MVLKAARMAAARRAKEITDEILWDCLEAEVEGLTAYKKALDGNTQIYGTKMSQQAQDLVRQRGKVLRG